MLYGAERVCRKALLGAGLFGVVSTVTVGYLAATAMMCACLCHFGRESFTEIRSCVKSSRLARIERKPSTFRWAPFAFGLGQQGRINILSQNLSVSICCIISLNELVSSICSISSSCFMQIPSNATTICRQSYYLECEAMERMILGVN